MAPTTATGATTTAAKPAPAGNNAAGARAENPAGRGAYLTDDEILGLVSDAMSRDREVSRETDEDAARSARQRKNANGANAASSENGT
ncbi:MAG: hypothetical protein ACRD5R_15530, partial [Candidatus Acidiferrales bacterium]